MRHIGHQSRVHSNIRSTYILREGPTRSDAPSAPARHGSAWSTQTLVEGEEREVAKVARAEVEGKEATVAEKVAVLVHTSRACGRSSRASNGRLHSHRQHSTRLPRTRSPRSGRSGQTHTQRSIPSTSSRSACASGGGQRAAPRAVQRVCAARRPPRG
eukprot:scaffold99292_cov32-Tisochrysis_lutea.AAC.4